MGMPKFISSDMAGAPSLTGQAGSLIAVLDACLVNGFGTATVDSIVIAGGIATVTRAAGHPFEVGSIALISGATVSGGSINGEQRVLSAPSSTVYTFDATGIPNQSATGTISHKVAPLGFTKAFSGTNLAAYQSSDPASTQAYLRVDDTGTTSARVVGYQTMSAISTGLGPFPTSGQVSGGGYWNKSNTSDATARPWIICGDERGFLYFVSWNSTALATIAATSASYYFGDLNSLKSPDPYCATLVAATSLNLGSGFADLSQANPCGNSPVGNQWVSRGGAGVGSAVALARQANMVGGAGTAVMSGSSSMLQYPNPANNGLYVVPLNVVETSPVFNWRGSIPGVYFCPHTLGATVFAQKETVDSLAGLPGRTLRAICNGTGVLFTDVTGPWR